MSKTKEGCEVKGLIWNTPFKKFSMHQHRGVSRTLSNIQDSDFYIKGFQSLTIFAKNIVLEVWPGSWYMYKIVIRKFAIYKFKKWKPKKLNINYIAILESWKHPKTRCINTKHKVLGTTQALLLAKFKATSN